jgi:outer membrane protein OmpA-like peptidoglycan-associated protein
MSRYRSTFFWVTIWTTGLVAASHSAFADERRPSPPQEPAGFVTGGVIGALAGGPFGAVFGAGLGTWLGNRVHRAGEADHASVAVAELMSDKNELIAKNHALGSELESLTQAVKVAKEKNPDAASVLDGLNGTVLFRTGHADIDALSGEQLTSLAKILSKAPGLKIRIDGYADPRGTVPDNLKLSESRAKAVRDLLHGAGVDDASLEVNAFGDSEVTAAAGDLDGYALERRVSITLEAIPAASVAQVGENE